MKIGEWSLNRELEMLDAIVHNLEQSNHIARIKKLVFCACTNNWSNEAQQLSTVKFKSHIQQLRDRHASIVELKYLLYRIVIRLNHSTNYYTVANLLCQEMEPLYAYQSTTATGDKSIDDDSTNDPLGRVVPTAMWGKEVIFTVEEIQGSILQVDMTIFSASRQLLTQTVVNFPDLAQMLSQYQEWQSRYRRLDPQNHRLTSSKAVSLVPERINDCLDAGAMLQADLHRWYSSPGFQTIRERLATTIDPELEIDIIVRSRSKILLRLPWNSIWQPFLDRYPQSEVSVSLIPTISTSATPSETLEVSVLSMLTSAQGIKLDRSKEYLDALPSTTSTFSVAPNHHDFIDLLTQQSWSVLFFSSYISGYLPNNRIYINHHDTVSISEFKYRIRTAVQRGLKLLILNCGEGLELASELVDLQIPNLIVMREAVQDQVAQEFVKLFLKAFSGGKSLQLAVRDARERLQAIEKVVPAASCLPMICQQIAAPASTWNRLAQIILTPTELAGTAQAEATGMVGDASYLDIASPASVVRPAIAYDRIALVHQLTGYFSEVYALALTADGQWLVSGHGDITHVDDAVKVWRLSDGKLIHNLLGHSHWIYSVALSTDGETIVSGSLDGTIQWWQLTTGTKLPQLLDNKAAVNAIALTPDGQRLVSGGNDAILKIWQPQNGLLIHQCSAHLQNVACIAVNQQTQLIASGSSDYTVRLWHLQEGRSLRTLLGHSGRVSGVAISPDGTKVVSVSHDCTVKIWEVATGNLINTLVGHTKPVGCVAISADGRTIVSAGDDRTVNIWNLSDGKLLHTISAHDRPILAVAISADSRTIATGSYGEIQVWRVPH